MLLLCSLLCIFVVAKLQQQLTKNAHDPPARRSFSIHARPKRLSDFIDFLLPVRALAGHVILVR